MKLYILSKTTLTHNYTDKLTQSSNDNYYPENYSLPNLISSKFNFLLYDFQQPYVRPVTEVLSIVIYITTVQKCCIIIYSSKTSVQWAAPHLTLMQNVLYIRLSEPGGCIGSR